MLFLAREALRAADVVCTAFVFVRGRGCLISAFVECVLVWLFGMEWYFFERAFEREQGERGRHDSPCMPSVDYLLGTLAIVRLVILKKLN